MNITTDIDIWCGSTEKYHWRIWDNNLSCW